MTDNLELYSRLSESLKLVFELASRTDERVKFLVDNDNKKDEKIDKVFSILNKLSADMISFKEDVEKITEIEDRILVIESDVIKISMFRDDSENRWRIAIDYFWKFMIAVASAATIYHFGFK